MDMGDTSLDSKIAALEQELADMKTDLEIAKLQSELKDEKIQRLKTLLNENCYIIAWNTEQLSDQRMGL